MSLHGIWCAVSYPKGTHIIHNCGSFNDQYIIK